MACEESKCCDLVVLHPAPPTELRELVARARQGQYPRRFVEQVMLFIVAVRQMFGATPVTPPALTQLVHRILCGQETVVLSGLPLGENSRSTVAALLAVCARFSMPGKVIEASAERAAELAASLAVQDVSSSESSADIASRRGDPHVS